MPICVLDFFKEDFVRNIFSSTSKSQKVIFYIKLTRQMIELRSSSAHLV